MHDIQRQDTYPIEAYLLGGDIHTVHRVQA